jgi:hypothetical protein
MAASLNEDCFVSESADKFPEAASKRVPERDTTFWKR